MHFLITAGPTHEPIDEVRYIGNRSSGRMGVAIAAAAQRAGHGVTLLLGPATVAPPPQCQTIRFRTAEELRTLLLRTAPEADLLVMAAAVADYRPKAMLAGRKIPRGEAMSLELEPVPDLLAEVATTFGAALTLVGFALEEPAALEERARAKVDRKGLDAIVANPLATMDAEGIEGAVILRDGRTLRPPGWPKPLPKEEFATWLVGTLTATFGPTIDAAGPKDLG
jgi:phosphopantothenoylcysteine decarboxylase/phosphopantothenate--cysteine ligase